MKFKSKIKVLFLAAALLLLCGCRSEKEEKAKYQIYYLNEEKTGLHAMGYSAKEKGTKGLVREFLKKLSVNPKDVEYRKALPDNVEIVKSKIEGDQLSIWFDTDYYGMAASEEVLCRASIVKTLIQIPEISCISFFVGDAPLVDAKDNVVGLMTGESFVENPGEQINAIQTVPITLYFSNDSGDGLMVETYKVHYNSNISMEKLVIEHLLEGPKRGKGKSAIPEGTNLLGATTVDGVCYVNFDSGFLNQNYKIQEPIVIYSIVDSLSELSTVSRVQISVNGSTKGVYRDSYKLDKVYDRNLDYLDGSKEEKKKGE
ncbi:MAG: GerMN domain-containing protein [Lachnospiraceae bacterium]|nr:GerMN domain-containing protein [Lachnospiraceae bacterium]